MTATSNQENPDASQGGPGCAVRDSWEHSLLALYRRVLRDGEIRRDRTGTGTLAVFGEKLDIDLRNGFPLATTKRVPFKAVLSELLWFLEGTGNERRLAEILHGAGNTEGKRTIWTDNAEGTTGSGYWAAYPGDLGRVYGVQWRNWRKFKEVQEPGTFEIAGRVDQIADIVSKLRDNPTDRRIIVSAYNVGELDQMTLVPCHMFAQFYMSNNRELDCQVYIRSSDTFLGLPFNIASYALLTMMLAQVAGAAPRYLKFILGDTHIYSNHAEQVKEMLSRDVRKPPEVKLDSSVQVIDAFGMEHFDLRGYDPHPAIPAPMAK